MARSAVTSYERIMKVLKENEVTRGDVIERCELMAKGAGRRSAVDFTAAMWSISTVAAVLELVAEHKL